MAEQPASSSTPATAPLATNTPHSASETSRDTSVATGRNRSAVSNPKQPARKQSKSKKSIPCKFFATESGCRTGDTCPFLHDRANVETLPGRARDQPAPNTPAITVERAVVSVPQGKTIQQNVFDTRPTPPAPRPLVAVVPKPVPRLQHAEPREFELNQVKRRFSPAIEETAEATVLTFMLVPSDPDFPFELDGLRTALTVPKSYPGNERPSIRVSNVEMERGYQINVERGFDALVRQFPKKTLLNLLNELDKNLEAFLLSEKAQTIKIIANAQTKVEPKSAITQTTPEPQTTVDIAPSQTFTEQEKVNARGKRESDLRQLEARMGRQPLFSKSPNGVDFNVPLQVPKPGRLPRSLQSVEEVRLVVPLSYNLEPCTIKFKDASEESDLIEVAFEQHARRHSELSLMVHVNHLVQNMHSMGVGALAQRVDSSVHIDPVEPLPQAAKPPIPDEDRSRVIDEDRPHLRMIARPPEWDIANTSSSEEDSSDSYESDSEENSEEDTEGGAQISATDLMSGPERGIQLSFPFLELYGIEVLEVSLLSLEIRCDRCKEVTDVKNLKSATKGGLPKSEPCKKCARIMSVAYRSELMHINSIRAGFLDLEGCTVVDLLPSGFLPTCAECSTTFPSPGVVSVRGETSMEVCRECHKKMSFKLPDVKFLQVSSATRPDRPLPRKKPKENLGIIAGQELPRKGRCQHYAKSYRWFRFSCCSKVYPCDRCHDGVEEHPNEHANRMICGLCSREQNYRPEDCAFCRSGLVGKKSGGFWEGGKGTRDKVKMSRKDPRKYKRRGGTRVGAK